MESNVPYIEIVPYQDEEEGASYDTDSKGNTWIQCKSKLMNCCKLVD